MEIFAEQTWWHKHKPDLLRRLLGCWTLSKEERRYRTDRRLSGGVYLGSLKVTYNNVASAVTDPNTGFVIKPGPQNFVHLVEPKIQARRENLAYYRQQAIIGMRRLVWHMRARFERNAQPELVMGVTFLPLARLAVTAGFRFFVPDQRVFTDDYRELMRREGSKVQRESKANLGSVRRLAIVYMPTQDLFATYGKPGGTSQQDVRELCSRARAEMTANSETGNQQSTLATTHILPSVVVVS